MFNSKFKKKQKWKSYAQDGRNHAIEMYFDTEVGH